MPHPWDSDAGRLALCQGQEDGTSSARAPTCPQPEPGLVRSTAAAPSLRAHSSSWRARLQPGSATFSSNFLLPPIQLSRQNGPGSAWSLQFEGLKGLQESWKGWLPSPKAPEVKHCTVSGSQGRGSRGPLTRARALGSASLTSCWSQSPLHVGGAGGQLCCCSVWILPPAIPLWLLKCELCARSLWVSVCLGTGRCHCPRPRV